MEVTSCRPNTRTCSAARKRRWQATAVGTLEPSLAEQLSSALKAPFLSSTVTRLLVDLNRSPHHPRVCSEFTRSLDRCARNDLITKWHSPHRAAVQETVEGQARRGRRVLHLGIHSFTPVLNGVRRKPDIALLYDPAQLAELTLAKRWAVALGSAIPDFVIRRNDPYRGTSDGLTTMLRRALQAVTYLGFEIEINQRLLGADGNFATHIGSTLFGTLGETLAHL
jgi:predicted N-formylglutamate amidohydrolase